METRNVKQSNPNGTAASTRGGVTVFIPATKDQPVMEPKKQSANKPVVTTSDTTKTTIVKSRKRTSLEEFSRKVRLRPEIKAGFKAWLNGRYFAFDDEWEQLFNDYRNRKI